MNLAKVALYLEYIAFCLRRECPVAKPMKSAEPVQTELPLPDPEPKQTPAVGIESRDSPAQNHSNGAAEKAEATKKRHGLNPELQAMAKIDRILSELPLRGRERVLAWVSDLAREAVAVRLEEASPL